MSCFDLQQIAHTYISFIKIDKLPSEKLKVQFVEFSDN